MSKLKTKSGAKKRFRLTASGKVRVNRAGKRHRLISNSPKQTRRLRGSKVLTSPDVKAIRRFLPYG